MNTGVLKTPDVGYPDPGFVLWRTEIEPEKRLRIVNVEDLPIERILQGRGLEESDLRGSFGITDKDEIIGRRDVMWYLCQNCKTMVDVLRGFDITYPPIEGDKFMTFYDPEQEHNPFWSQVKNLLDALKSNGPLPERLQILHDFLERSLPLEESEKQMAAEIGAGLEKIANIEGFVNLNIFNPFNHAFSEYIDNYSEEDVKEIVNKHIFISIDTTNAEVNGHREFSFALSKARYFNAPAWANHWLAKWNIGRLLKKRAEEDTKRSILDASREMVITTITPGLANDLKKGVKDLLTNLELDWKKVADFALTVYFCYDLNGLCIQPLNIKTLQTPSHYFNLNYSRFEGYSADIDQKIAERGMKMRAYVDNLFVTRESERLQLLLETAAPDLFQKRIIIPSDETDKEHRWFAVSNMYESSRFHDLYKAVKRHREYVKKHIGMLKLILADVSSMMTKAKELGATICRPDILDNDEHIFHVENLYPTQLVPIFQQRGDDIRNIVPINNIPSLNSDTLGISGVHTGGKSVAMKEIPAEVYIAQSGLLSFASKVAINVKRVIGVVFDTSVEGQSSCELLLTKAKNVFDELAEYPQSGNGILLIFDELGGGTQHDSGGEFYDGYKYALRILAAAHKRKATTIFCTQITQVFSEAEKRFGAMSLRVDRNHRFTQGIDSGGLDDLEERIGLRRLLN